jgi:hypothetical protein
MEPAQNSDFDKSLGYRHGDAFSGFDLTYQTPTGDPPAVPLARVVMQFRTSLLDETLASVKKTISSDEVTEIEITDAAAWSVSVKRQDLGLARGDYFWGMTFEDDDGLTDTLMMGKITVGPKVVVEV